MEDESRLWAETELKFKEVFGKNIYREKHGEKNLKKRGNTEIKTFRASGCRKKM